MDPQRSTDRVITTHVGSLPRPAEVIELLRRRDRDEPIDAAEFERATAKAVSDVVAKQVAVGLDVINDGEMSKASYATYIQQRLTGFGTVDKAKWPVEKNPDREAFPEYYARPATTAGPASRRMLGCVGPIEVKDRTLLDQDIKHLQTAVKASKANGALRERGVARPCAALSSEFPLPEYDRLSRRGRQGDARGIRGDRQSGLRPAGRLSRSRLRPAQRVTRN